MNKKYFYLDSDGYNFPFSDKLSIKNYLSAYGSIRGLDEVIDQLKNEYCFEIIDVIKDLDTYYTIDIVFPKGYSETKIQWVWK